MSIPSNVVSIQDPTIPIDQGIYEESTTQKTRIGARLRVGEKTFHYAKSASAFSAGLMYCAPSPIATKMAGTVALWTQATGQATSPNKLTVTVGTDVAANFFAEGQLGVSSAGLAGGGLLMRIKSHPAIGSAAAGVITLYDNIPTTTVAAGAIRLIQNQFDAVILGSQALDAPVGIAPIAVTAGNYCWLQTWGLANAKHVGNTVVNGALVLGTTGGVAVTADATTNGGLAAVAVPVGRHTNLAASASSMSPIYLSLTP